MHTDRLDSLTCWVNADRSKYSMPLFSDLLDTYRQVRHTDTDFTDLLNTYRQVRHTTTHFRDLLDLYRQVRHATSCFPDLLAKHTMPLVPDLLDTYSSDR
jgi:hypothetical protein